jgi:hypothetical protein
MSGEPTYDSLIQGGAKRYAHVQYGLYAATKRDLENLRFYKKSWVPKWLWNLFATPDYADMIDKAMKRATEEYEKRLLDNIRGAGERGE